MPQRRYRNNLSNYSAYNNIGTIGFNPVTFNPVTFEPKENDMTLLAQGMARDEQRRDNAFTTYETLNKTLAEYGKKFSDDPETKKWFDDNNKRITDIVNQSIQAGDWERATIDSQRLASEFLNSREFMDRENSFKEYNKKLATVDAMRQQNKIDQDTYDWWIKNNKYQFNPETGRHKDINMPAESVNWPEVTYQAFQMIKPDVISNTRGSTYSRTEAGQTNIDTTYNPRGMATRGGGYQKTNNYQEVTKEDIRNQLDNILRVMPDGYRRLEQDFEVRKDAYLKLEQEYNDIEQKYREGTATYDDVNNAFQKLERQKSFWYRNGSLASFSDYCVENIYENAIAEGLAYKQQTNSYTDSNIFTVHEQSPRGNTGKNPQTGEEEEVDPYTNEWVAPKTVDSTPGEAERRGVAEHSNNIKNAHGI